MEEQDRLKQHGAAVRLYRARYYHLGIARFASRDPMGMVDAISPYAYVANNPVNYTDPTGEIANFVVGAIYGGIAGGVGGAITAGLSPNQTFGSTLKSIGLGFVAAAAAGLARTVGTVTATAAVGGASSAAGQLSGNVATGQPLGTKRSASCARLWSGSDQLAKQVVSWVLANEAIEKVIP